MANWAEVEFRNPTKYRRLKGAVSLAADLLMLWDFLVSVACGQSANAVWRVGSAALAAPEDSAASFLPEVVIGSLTLALALRFATHLKACDSVSTRYSFSSPHRCFLSTIIAFIAVALAVQIGHRSAQIWIVAWLFLLAPILATTRWGLVNWLIRLEKSGVLRESVAIVGASGARERLAVRIASEADIVGFYRPPSDRMRLLHPKEVEKLQELGADGCVDSVVFAVETEHATDISQIVERLKMLPVQVAICDDGERSRLATTDIRYLGGIPMKIVTKRPINRRDLLIKTVLDKMGGIFLLVVLFPLMFIVAVLIATTSRGPVIFRQTRQGWCGQRFTVLKFRSMHDTPKTCLGYAQTRRSDPRCTPVGRFLRSTSLDELPQLWNVVRGDMSLVGPRPHADMLDEDDQSGREIIAEYAQRYRVRPGITGWAQIHGARGATSTVEQLRRRVAFDLYYIEHWSIWLDLKILARTPFCMAGKNAF